MSDSSTTRMLEMYEDEAGAPLFLSGFFQSPAKNFHNTEKVEIDVLREDEEVAVVISDLTAGPRQNKASIYTNKGFTPPIIDEEGSVHVYDQIKRQPGQNPFENPDFARNAGESAMRLFGKLERKIRRTIELMASQVLQTGVITLVDSAGTALYTLDFQPRTTHLVTPTAWAVDGSTGAPLTDIDAIARVIRRNGKKSPDQLIFGSSALQRFLANADVKAQLDNRAMEIGRIAPEIRGEGATYVGRIWVSNYWYDMWTYDGEYKHPQTGTMTPYIDTNKLIVRASKGRLDLTFGAMPSMVAPDPRAAGFLDGRMAFPEIGLDISPNAYFEPNGKSLKIGAGTRPLAIPTAIDTFGCLTVGS